MTSGADVVKTKKVAMIDAAEAMMRG